MSKFEHIFALALALAVAITASGRAALEAQGYPNGDRFAPTDQLVGTYELDRSRSDDPQQVADRAARTLDPAQRDRVRQNLLNRLDAPDSLAIDLRGRSVTIMSSDAPRVTFDADGRDREEPGPNGRTVTTHADLRAGELMVSTTGNRGSDFTVRFDPMPGGLRVTRDLDSDYLQTRVSSQAFYRRVSNEPRWTVYDGGRYGRDRSSGPRADILVPDGTVLTARLDRDLGTRSSREGDVFTMTVSGPGPYRGSVLTGVVSRTGEGQGRADMVFDFNRIRLNNGQSEPFEGAIESVHTPDGQNIRVDRSGAVRDRGVDSATAQDSALGAALGAVIGAIAGGGKGAAVGAVVGGAGTLVVESQNDLNLPAGSELTISAVAPR